MEEKKKNIYMLELLKQYLGHLIKSVVLLDDEIHCFIEEKHIKIFFKILKTKTELSFKQLLDIWVIDYIKKEKRFEVNYNLLNLKINIRLRVRVFLKNYSLNSIVGIYKSAKWLEREAWDMFGVYFLGNDDLRRILTDYGFRGNPLRKDYPLMGYLDVYYCYKTKRIKMVPINLIKKIVENNYINPWI